VGVFNVGGSYFGLLNRCPHKAAPLCAGAITSLVSSKEPYKFELEREGEILRCPWHGWEFEIATGRSVFNPHKVRVRTYEVTVESSDDTERVETFPVSVEQDMVVLHLPDRGRGDDVTR
jgi:3-phenylpropionate/trans-cinnamate dioxygenase ferredoxin subunit